MFDASGRHLRTLDGLLGTQLYEFGYDAAGRLLRVQDADGRKTYVDRDANGAPRAIIAPDGRRTTLALNAGAKLASFTTPLSDTRTFHYDAGGRLDRQDLPSGRHSSYVYAPDDGRLTQATGAAGQTRSLSRIDPDDYTHVVDVTTGAGRTTRYKVERSISGALTRTVTSPSGAVTTLAVDSVGKRTVTLPSGERRITVPTADARFGGAVQRPLELTTSRRRGSPPRRASSTSRRSRPKVRRRPTSMSTRQTLPNGTVRTEAYDGTHASFTTTTSPATRRTRRVLDARARLVRVELGNQALTTKLDPITVAYDAAGVSEVRQGSQVTRYEHDAAGRLTAIVAADGQRLEYTYDAADRLTERRYAGGRTYRYGYDADGELTSRGLPSTRTHAFTPTGFMDEISAWTPPGGAGSYSATRDADELATSVTTPTGALRTVSFDAAGRVTGAAFPGAARTASYIPGVDRVRRYESTAAPGSAVQSLEAEFDGMRVTKLTAGGLSPAETTWSYSPTTLLQTSSRLVSGADDTTLGLTYDAEGLLTGVGPFTYERNGPDRTLSAITDGAGAHRGDHRHGGRPEVPEADGRRIGEVPARADHGRDRTDHGPA